MEKQSPSTIEERILAFISNFDNPGTVKTFTEGCCYWFAYILNSWCDMNKERLNHRMMYNQVLGHFACEIEGRLYDVTGKIEYDKDWVPWADWFTEEIIYRDVVVRDCILKSKEN